jgi:hypothetical protein
MHTQFGSRHLVLAGAFCVMLGSSVVGCATTQTQPYNPDSLDAARFGRVAAVCQNVMGLSPAEPLSGGYWMGNDRLDYWTSNYRGCIVSLSDSIRSEQGTQLAQQADADCRGQGLKPSSPDLALCVLHAVNNPTQAGRAPTATAAATLESSQLPAVSVSFYRASYPETARREQVACAALGLEPTQGSFQSCVKGLDDTFYALEHPIN